MVSTVPESVRQIKTPEIGMMQLVLQEKERRRCFDGRAKVVCVFLCVGRVNIYIYIYIYGEWIT